MITTTLEPFDEAVYDAARAICADRAILGGAHAFDDSATYATSFGIRQWLMHGRRSAEIPSGQAVGAALKRLTRSGLVKRVQLVRRYKTRPPKPYPHPGYVVVGEKP